MSGLRLQFYGRMGALDVAVIIPVKNRAELLAATLGNILRQSLAPAEVLVVDDGSTDHLREVIGRFGGQVRCVRNTGKGPGAARNLGLSLTKAPLVQFFDSDDLMTVGKLEAQANALLDAEADMAYGPYVQAQELEDGSWSQVDAIMQARPLPDPHLLKWMLRGWNAITQSMLFRRSFLEKCPAWDEQLITHEDYLYMARMAAQKPIIVHVPDEAVIYRQHGLQSTADHTVTASRAADKWEVMQRMHREGLSADVDMKSWILFDGRLGLTQDFAAQVSIPMGEHTKSSIYSRLLYRMFNKFERLKTGSNWETMHGIDAAPESFSYIVGRIA